jgi:hypothetical protein
MNGQPPPCIPVRAVSIKILLVLAALLALPAPLFALTWRWSNPQPNGDDITGLAKNGNVSVAVAARGQISLGYNFYNWVPCVVPTTNDLQAVTFFGNRLVAVGESGTVVYSDDYANFTAVNLNTSGNWLIAVAASPSLLVTVGDNAVIYTSSNGAAWTAQAQPPRVGSAWLESVAYGNGWFVIGGDNGYAAVSTNGVTWTYHGISTSGSIFWLAYVSGSGSLTNFPYPGFWAATDTGQAWYSTNNGVAWKQFPGINSTNIFYSLAVNKSSGLIAGDTDLRLGTNTAAWLEQAATNTMAFTNFTAAPAWTYYDALWDTNGDYQLAGADGMLVQGTPHGSLYNWAQQYPANVYDWLFAVTFVDGLYVAVGDHARIMSSEDGADWTTEQPPLTNSVSSAGTFFLCVGGDTNLLVAAGNQGSLAVSPQAFVPVVQTNLDGTLVTNLANTIGLIWNSLPAPVTGELTAVGVYSNRYYLTGSGGTLLASTNGTNWINYHVPVTNDLSGIAASSNTMVIVGDYGAIITSANGTNWTIRSSGTKNALFRVRWLNGVFLAVGENGTILRSTNAISWYAAAATGTTNWLNDAVAVSNTCYVVGNYGTVLASADLNIWTNVPLITPRSLYGAATQNGQLVVVGLEGAILRSQIVPLTNAVNFLAYSQADNENIFLLSGIVDQQCTLDYSTNLSGAWNTGPLLNFYYGDGTLELIQPLPLNAPTQQFYRCTLVP